MIRHRFINDRRKPISEQVGAIHLYVIDGLEAMEDLLFIDSHYVSHFFIEWPHDPSVEYSGKEGCW